MSVTAPQTATEIPPIASRMPSEDYVDYELTCEAAGQKMTLFVQFLPSKLPGKKIEEYLLQADMCRLISVFNELRERSQRLYGHP